MRYVNNSRTMQVTRSLAMSQEIAGAMICIRGAKIGSMITLQNDKKIIVGRDASTCNYVIPDLKVSRRHFEIVYIGAINKYLVKDCSSNGTFIQNGARLNKNQEYYLPPKTELRLGGSEYVYKLR